MSMRNVILYEAKPILEEQGYMLRTSSRGSYCFCKCDMDSSIFISFEGPRSFVRSLDVSYLIRKGKHYVLSFGFRDFPNGTSFIYPPNPTSTVDDYLHNVIKMTKEEVLPYIEAIAQFHVSISQHLYRHLAQCLSRQAEELLDCGKPPIIKSEEEFSRLDNMLKGLRPTELEFLQPAFTLNESKVLEIAAALGELLRVASGQKYHWGWYHPRKSNHLEDVSDHTFQDSIYGLVSTSGDVLYVDPLAEVLDVWNHAELRGRTLRRFAYP